MQSFHFRMIVGLICTVLLAGCGPAKFDGSSAAGAAKSFHAMTAGMTEVQRQEFMARATAVSSLQNAGASVTPSADTMWKGIHGLTKAEIEAKANELLPTKTPAPAK